MSAKLWVGWCAFWIVADVASGVIGIFRHSAAWTIWLDFVCGAGMTVLLVAAAYEVRRQRRARRKLAEFVNSRGGWA